MVVLEYTSTTMASLASPTSLRSATVSSSGYSEGLQRVSLSKNVHSFHKFWVQRRCRVCKYSVTTDYIAEQGTSVSLDSTYKGSKYNDAALVLKAAPKPVVRSGSKTGPLLNINSISSMPWDLSKLNKDSEDEKLNDDKEEMNKVIESLGEALEKAEKLESSKKVSVPVNKSPLNTSTNKRNGKPVNLTVGRKSKTLKSIWRKGNAVASVQKIIKESPKTEKVEKQEPRIEGAGSVESEKLEYSKKASVPVNKSPLNTSTAKRNAKPVNLTVHQKSKTLKSVWRKGNAVATEQKIVKEFPKIEKVEKHEPRIEGGGNVESLPVSPLRPPKPPTRVQPKLQAKPSIAPPPMIKKPVILKDVGAPPKTPATGGNNLDAKTKERKPMLIDKFVPKKPVVDPLITQAVLAPPKSAKGLNPGKFIDEFRKKSGPLGGQRRRMVNNVEIPDEETSELDVSIPGAATARKGRKRSKASWKAARLQAAKEAAPVKVEILEVGEEGMSTEELAHNLAISEGEILGYLSSMRIKPDGVQTLDKNMVKMICKEYEVEVVDATPVRVEEMAKKKEILDEEDLESLEDRPPVLTIMGHVDHGKV